MFSLVLVRPCPNAGAGFQLASQVCPVWSVSDVVIGLELSCEACWQKGGGVNKCGPSVAEKGSIFLNSLLSVVD